MHEYLIFLFLLFMYFMVLVSSHNNENEVINKKPYYKYRYETEEMKSDATSVPVRGGYQVYEGDEGGFGFQSPTGNRGFFRRPVQPFRYNFGLGQDFGGFGFRKPTFGYNGGYNGGVGGPYFGRSFLSSPLPLSQGMPIVGGQEIDRNYYNGEKKNLDDEEYEKSSGKKIEEVDHDKEGFNKGVAIIKNNKEAAGHFNDESKGKKIFEDGKSYHGDHVYNQEDKSGGEANEKSGHKKGHVIKGFKTSHHKDETGKTEEYYDEKHDEGDKINFDKKFDSFGEKGASAYKGGHENGNFAAGAHKNEGHYNDEHFVDNSNADEGKYGEKKYASKGIVYGANNGIDHHSLLGHQEGNRLHKHIPHYVPFY